MDVFITLALKQIYRKLKLFIKNWSPIFWLRVPQLKTEHSNTQLPCQKLILRQINRRVQNGPITKNLVVKIKLSLVKLV